MQPTKTKYPEWAVRGSDQHKILSSIYIDPEDEEITNLRILERWLQVEDNEVRFKEYYLDDADIVVIGYGTAGRVSYSAVRAAREKGIKVGLFRPITLNPLPSKQISEIANNVSAILVVEMNTGQMLFDVQRVAGKQVPIAFYGRPGGVVPFPEEILTEIERINSGKLEIEVDPRRSWLHRMKNRIN